MNVTIVGDGRMGYESESPYNAIHVGAAAGTIPTEVTYVYMLHTVNYLICDAFFFSLSYLLIKNVSCFNNETLHDCRKKHYKQGKTICSFDHIQLTRYTIKLV